jgi:hypothetical protein
MFGLRLTIERHARSKNGQPAHHTTGVANTRLIQFTALMLTKRMTPPLMTMSAIASTNTGTPSTSDSQKRLVMSISSGLGPSSSATTRGSSAMPQIGHAPGRSRTISGCIGQVYSVPGAAGASWSAGSLRSPVSVTKLSGDAVKRSRQLGLQK